MPENKLPPPGQVLGNTKIPPPDAVLNTSAKSSGTDYSFLAGIQADANTDEIIDKLDASADEKKIIKNLAIAEKAGRATKDDVSEAILTVQGQHPKQEGGVKYYMKDGKPIPIRNDEKPPQGYDVASIWGSQDSANDDSFLTSAAKHLYNGVVGAAESIANLPQIPYGAITGEELPWYQTMKNAGEYLKFKTPEYEKEGQLFDTNNLQEASDFFDPSRYNFNKNNIQGAVLSGLESITSFLVGAKGLGGATKTAGALGESAGILSKEGSVASALSGTSNAGKLANGFASSYMINYDEALQAAENAGLSGQDKYAFASVATIPTALLEMVGGTEATFIKNGLARQGKKEMLKSLAVGLEEETAGKLTKESLEGLYKATTVAATKLNKTFAGELAKNVGGEAATEAAQAFALNSAKNIYDSISGEEKFKTDPFSLESWGEYVNNALAGGLGAFGPGVAATAQKRKVDKAEAQSNNAYETVKKGPQAITELKADIDNSVKSGELTPIQGENAKFKVDVYNEYYQQTKDIKLDEEERKKVIDLSYSISGVKSEIPTKESDIEKLSPIELAQVNAKKELVKGLQKELDAIILKDNVKKETNVGPDTINKVEKREEKQAEQTPLEELQKRYNKASSEPESEAETESKPKQESTAKPDVNAFVNRIKAGDNLNNPDDLQFYQNNKREIEDELQNRRSERRKGAPKFDQVDDKGRFEFNKQKPLEKKEILHDYFDEHPELGNEMEGFIEQGQNNVWHVNLGGTGRFIQFGNSILADKYIGKKENFPSGKEIVKDSDGRELERFKDPVGVKLESIKTDDGGIKRVVNIYNKRTGDHIVFGKELEKGNSKYTPDEIKQLQAIQKRKYVPLEQPEIQQEEVVAELEVKKPKPVVSKEEADKAREQKEATKKAISKIYSSPPKTFEESVVRYLLNKGRVSTSDFKRYMGFGEKNERTGKTKGRKEFNQYIWAVKNDGPSIDNLVKTLWKEDLEREDYDFDEQDRINEFFDVLSQHSGKRSLANRLFEIQRDFSEAEEYASKEDMRMAKEAEEAERYFNTHDLTEEEVNSFLEQDLAREQVFAETGQFQKKSDLKGDLDKVVERIKKSFPKMNVVYNPDLKAAGYVKGKTLEINPRYAGKDTPIHEGGHILIDAIGYTDKVIQKGINQLKGTPLWENTQERYPELTEEQLGKEVLAEAIGMEGAGIFATEAAKSKFRAILDYIFTRIKQLFGMDRNIAKSLAKQVIGGVKTKDLTGSGNDQYQKPKKKTFKTLEEMSATDLAKKLTMSLEAYREKVLGRSLEQIRKDLHFINDALESDKYSAEEKKAFRDVKASIDKEAKKDASKWYAYKEDVEMLSSIMSEQRLEDMTDEKLVEAYNLMSANFQDEAKDSKLNQLKLQIAYRMFQKRKSELGEYKDFVEEQANKTDISRKDILLKTLSHVTQNQPELQKFSNLYENAHFDMQVNRADLKSELEGYGKEVIKEKNKSLGITDKAKEFVMSGGVKYFDFVEHPDGRYYTMEEAKEKGFTPAQTRFLKFMHKLNDLRNEQLSEMDVDQVNNEVLKVDKGVKEAFREDGILEAFSAFLGNGHNLQNVRINYNGKPTSYGDIEKDLIAKGKSGEMNKMKAVLQMAKYQLAARRQLKTGTNVDEKENPLSLVGGSEYNLSTDGRLKSKFNKPRDKSRGYSKDFYKAAHSFIDDYTHVKHMGPLLPYIQSIEHLNRMGFKEHERKENVAEWVKQWTDLHIFKKEKVGQLGPELDTFFKLLRKLTSLSVMAFNYPAGAWNLAMGIYNNIRAETADIQRIGLKRLFGGTNRGGYGAYNKKAAEILKKYHVVSFDTDSNPNLGAGKVFETMANGVTRAGEYTIQGSLFLGLMSQEEYNSFELKNEDGVEKLVLKDGVDANKIKEKFITYKNRISDIQGKYSEKDRRNFQAGEFGKAAIQFRLWTLDWLKERFGSKYIDSNGNVKMGSWRQFVGEGLDELKADIKEKGVGKALWENKNAMANLKGAMTVAVFLSLALGGDDDKKKRKAGDNIDKALGNLLFVFDPESLKFMVDHPIASMSTVSRFVSALEHGMKFDLDRAASDVGAIIPYNKSVKQVVDLMDEE